LTGKALAAARLDALYHGLVEGAGSRAEIGDTGRHRGLQRPDPA
jgi:hypothetical protein